MVAAHYDLANIAEAFLTHGADPDITIHGHGGKVNALAVAASHGHKEVFSVLVEHGADRNEAFHAAVSKGYEDIVANLLDKGVNIDDQEKGEDDRTALMTAALDCHKDVFTLLIEKGANMNLHDKYGNTALIYSLFHSGLISCRPCLKTYSGSMQTENSCFMTLLRRGADVGIKNFEGKTILLQIRNCAESWDKHYQALVDYGANVNDKVR